MNISAQSIHKISCRLYFHFFQWACIKNFFNFVKFSCLKKGVTKCLCCKNIILFIIAIHSHKRTLASAFLWLLTITASYVTLPNDCITTTFEKHWKFNYTKVSQLPTLWFVLGVEEVLCPFQRWKCWMKFETIYYQIISQHNILHELWTKKCYKQLYKCSIFPMCNTSRYAPSIHRFFIQAKFKYSNGAFSCCKTRYFTLI